MHGCPGLDVSGERAEVGPSLGDVFQAVGVTAVSDGSHVHAVVFALGGPEFANGQSVEEWRHSAPGLVLVDFLRVVDDRGTSSPILAHAQFLVLGVEQVRTLGNFFLGVQPDTSGFSGIFSLFLNLLINFFLDLAFLFVVFLLGNIRSLQDRYRHVGACACMRVVCC